MALAHCEHGDLEIIATVVAAHLDLRVPSENVLELLTRLEERGHIRVAVENGIVQVTFPFKRDEIPDIGTTRATRQ